MVPAASWLSRAASQVVSGSHFCPGKRAPIPFILKGLGWAGERITAGLGAQRNRSWPQRAGNSTGAEWPSNRMSSARLSIREKICLPGSLAGAGRGREWVVVTAFQTGYLSSLLSLTEEPLPEVGTHCNSCPTVQLGCSHI